MIALLLAAKTKNPLIPATNELVWGTVSFVLLLVILWRVGVFQRITEALARRTELIQGNIEKAEQTREEADLLLQQYRDRLESARDEADRIIREAREAADRVRKELQEKAKEESDRIVESARAEIRAERDRAARELRREVGILAVQVAERVVGESLDGDRQLQLVDAYVEELAASVGPTPDAGDGGGPTAGGGA
ncbi:MAG: F0F1 ATP synthase subunit B [Actinomycetota bacterium]